MKSGLRREIDLRLAELQLAIEFQLGDLLLAEQLEVPTEGLPDLSPCCSNYGRCSGTDYNK